MTTTGKQIFTTLESDGTLTVEVATSEFPEPKGNQVLVKMEAAPINPSDLALLVGQADLENARAALAEAEAARGELTVLRTQLAELGPEEQRLRAQKAQAELDLEDRTIVMPFDGVVDRVFVDKGEYVTPGQRLLMVHDLLLHEAHVRRRVLDLRQVDGSVGTDDAAGLAGRAGLHDRRTGSRARRAAR